MLRVNGNRFLRKGGFFPCCVDQASCWNRWEACPWEACRICFRRTWALLPGWNSRRVNEMTEIIRQCGVLRWRGPERASLTSWANAKNKTKQNNINTVLKDLNQRNPWRWNWKLTHHEQLMWKFDHWQTYNNACNGKSLLIAQKIPPPSYKLLPLHRSTKSFRY